MTDAGETVRGSSVAIGARGVLITGPSGSGKSDLALRLIDRGAALVSDDYTLVEVRDGNAWASAPANIAGLIEVRGIGPVQVAHVEPVALAFVVLLGDAPDRLPEPGRTHDVAGIALPALALDAFAASAPIKVAMALAALDR